MLLLLATGCHQEGVDPYSVPVFTSERTDRSLCGMVSTCDAIVIGSSAELGTNGPVRYSSGTYTMTQIRFSAERVLFGTAPNRVEAVFHGGVTDAGYSFPGHLSGVLAGKRGVWFLQQNDGITSLTGNGVFTEEHADVFAATELDEPRYSLAQILDEIALRGAAPRNNRGCSR